MFPIKETSEGESLARCKHVPKNLAELRHRPLQRDGHAFATLVIIPSGGRSVEGVVQGSKEASRKEVQLGRD